MKQLKINARTVQEAAQAHSALDRYIAEHGAVTITVGPYKAKRTLDQNSLSHAWYSELAEAMAMTPDEVKTYCKYHLGFAILAETDRDYIDRLREAMRPLTYDQRMTIVERFPVTSMMNKTQLNNYLDAMIMHFAQKLGITLTIPADLTLEQYPEQQK